MIYNKNAFYNQDVYNETSDAIKKKEKRYESYSHNHKPFLNGKFYN